MYLRSLAVRRTMIVRLFGHPLVQDSLSELVDFLRENQDIFAWSPKDMPGVPTEFVEHKLHVRPDVKPVRQPLRRLSEEKRRVVGEEIARLLAAGFIMEVFFLEWLANPVLVLKKNNK